MLSAVTEFAAAKINLALHVLGRRADGYHELDSIVAFADVGDTLTLTRAVTTSLTITGPEADALPVSDDNLILNAYRLLAEAIPLPPVAFNLTKRLPVASGIGGGSADAAAALRGLLKLSGQSLPSALFQSMALKLGADVPVCLFGKACRMQGVGEMITALPAPPSSAILLVNPRLPCSTADVFKKIGLSKGQIHRAALEETTPSSWRNDMTEAAIEVQPRIAEVLATLADITPQRITRMSGSGATCFTMFDDIDDTMRAANALRSLRTDWWIEPARLS